MQGGFIFVAVTGRKGEAQDKGTRMRLRAHVMHNFQDKKAELKQRKVPEDGNWAGQQAGLAPTNAGQKLSFRLKEDGQLEENVPLRQRKKKADQQNDAEHDVEEPAQSGNRKQPAAASSPDFETWTRQYFGDQLALQPELQPDFQSPFLLPASEKQQYRTVTEGHFHKNASKNF